MVFTTGQVVWRFPLAFQIVISLISVALLFPLPDTPRWYYAKGREAEADDVLQRLCVGSTEKLVRMGTRCIKFHTDGGFPLV